MHETKTLCEVVIIGNNTIDVYYCLFMDHKIYLDQMLTSINCYQDYIILYYYYTIILKWYIWSSIYINFIVQSVDQCYGGPEGHSRLNIGLSIVLRDCTLAIRTSNLQSPIS